MLKLWVPFLAVFERKKLLHPPFSFPPIRSRQMHQPSKIKSEHQTRLRIAKCQSQPSSVTRTHAHHTPYTTRLTPNRTIHLVERQNNQQSTPPDRVSFKRPRRLVGLKNQPFSSRWPYMYLAHGRQAGAVRLWEFMINYNQQLICQSEI